MNEQNRLFDITKAAIALQMISTSLALMQQYKVLMEELMDSSSDEDEHDQDDFQQDGNAETLEQYSEDDDDDSSSSLSVFPHVQVMCLW